ncbi:hypothetical protein MMC14_008821 [Varicellaria rhodocarpa]|nr:hypothetical protein [Varicellaria rhodocarpa]
MDYPMKTKQSAGMVDGIPTDVMLCTFLDKILVTVTQRGRLAQWIQVPLDNVNLSLGDNLSAGDDDDGLLPRTHLTPRTLLGGSNSERETVGQLYATQVASAILSKDPTESRTVLLGLGLVEASVSSREVFYDVLELLLQCV